MLALIEKDDHGYIVKFERNFKYSVEEVWGWLTENDKLAQWFSELRITDLREDGIITFDMQDGTFEEMTILELTKNAVFEFTWAEDIVRFELYAESENCRLILKEKLKEITNHTPKDVAGWHVCLDVIRALMDGTPIASRKEEWSKWYEKYVQAFKEAEKR